MAAGEAYFARAHADLLEMGLADSAAQLLSEALAAYPRSEALLRLAGRESGAASPSEEKRGASAVAAGQSDRAVMDEAYFVRAHQEFVDMGLRESGSHLLAQALEVHPGSQRLQQLACRAGGGAGTPCCELSAPSAPLAAPGDGDMPAAEFWPAVREGGLHRLLLQRGGLLRVVDLLPEGLAEAALRALERVPASEWTLSTTDSVAYGDGDAIRHTYYSYLGDQIDGVRQELRALSPQQWSGFQAARYEQCGHIAPHDDSQMFQIPDNNHNPGSQHSPGSTVFRKIACIYYLTKDWRQEYGGSLIDLHHPEYRRAFVPKFNSMVAFVVPRVHEVEALAQGCPPRYSIFGWFSDGRRYPPLHEFGAEMSCMEAWRARR